MNDFSFFEKLKGGNLNKKSGEIDCFTKDKPQKEVIKKLNDENIKILSSLNSKLLNIMKERKKVQEYVNKNEQISSLEELAKLKQNIEMGTKQKHTKEIFCSKSTMKNKAKITSSLISKHKNYHQQWEKIIKSPQRRRSVWAMKEYALEGKRNEFFWDQNIDPKCRKDQRKKKVYECFKPLTYNIKDEDNNNSNNNEDDDDDDIANQTKTKLHNFHAMKSNLDLIQPLTATSAKSNYMWFDNSIKLLPRAPTGENVKHSFKTSEIRKFQHLKSKNNKTALSIFKSSGDSKNNNSNNILLHKNNGRKVNISPFSTWITKGKPSKMAINKLLNKSDISFHQKFKELTQLNAKPSDIIVPWKLKINTNQSYKSKNTNTNLNSNSDNNSTRTTKKVNKDHEKYRILMHKQIVDDSMSCSEGNNDLFLDVDQSTYTIDPDGLFKISWDYIIFIIILYYWLLLPYYMSSTNFPPLPITLFNIIFDIMFICDFFLNFFVSFYTIEEDLVRNLNIIIKEYMQSSLFITDLMCSIPFGVIFAKYRTTTRENVYTFSDFFIFIKWLKVIKLVNNNQRTYIHFFFLQNNVILTSSLQRMIKFLLCFWVISHFISCIWIFIANLNPGSNWMVSANVLNETFSVQYWSSIYFHWTTIFTIGYGDILSANIAEKIYNCILLFVGILIYSFTISSLGSMLTNSDDITMKYEENRNYLEELRSKNNIPENFYMKLWKHLKFNYKNNKREKYSFINDLPNQIKIQLLGNMYRNIIKKCSFFKYYSIEYATTVVHWLKPIRVFKNEWIVNQGEFWVEVYFVQKGILTILLNEEFLDRKVIDLRQNEYFGDIWVETNERCPFNVKVSSKMCDLLVLKKEDFNVIKEEFQEQLSESLIISYYNYQSLLDIAEEKKKKIKTEINKWKKNKENGQPKKKKEFPSDFSKITKSIFKKIENKSNKDINEKSMTKWTSITQNDFDRENKADQGNNLDFDAWYKNKNNENKWINQWQFLEVIDQKITKENGSTNNNFDCVDPSSNADRESSSESKLSDSSLERQAYRGDRSGRSIRNDITEEGSKISWTNNTRSILGNSFENTNTNTHKNNLTINRDWNRIQLNNLNSSSNAKKRFFAPNYSASQDNNINNIKNCLLIRSKRGSLVQTNINISKPRFSLKQLSSLTSSYKSNSIISDKKLTKILSNFPQGYKPSHKNRRMSCAFTEIVIPKTINNTGNWKETENIMEKATKRHKLKELDKDKFEKSQKFIHNMMANKKNLKQWESDPQQFLMDGMKNMWCNSMQIEQKQSKKLNILYKRVWSLFQIKDH